MAKLVPVWKDSEEDQLTSLWRGCVSEFTATMMFIFLGCGSVTASFTTLGEQGIAVPSLICIALGHGFAITFLVYSVGEISGGHLNPAVTWACLITKRISIVRAIGYWIAQFGGGVVGALLLRAILPVESHYNLGCHGIHSSLTAAQGWFAESVFTAFFVFVVFATAISPFAGKMAPLQGGNYGPGKLTPLAVGLCILVLHLVGVPITGASMNPARSFGPAVVAGGDCWNEHWIYWVGPLTGSTISAFVSQAIFLHNPDSILKILNQKRVNVDIQSSNIPEGAIPLENKD